MIDVYQAHQLQLWCPHTQYNCTARLTFKTFYNFIKIFFSSHALSCFLLRSPPSENLLETCHLTFSHPRAGCRWNVEVDVDSGIGVDVDVNVDVDVAHLFQLDVGEDVEDVLRLGPPSPPPQQNNWDFELFGISWSWAWCWRRLLWLMTIWWRVRQ